jgi:hypothetical protein
MAVTDMIAKDNDFRATLQRYEGNAKDMVRLDALYSQLCDLVGGYRLASIDESKDELAKAFEVANRWLASVDVASFLVMTEKTEASEGDLSRCKELLKADGSGTKLVQAYFLCEDLLKKLKDRCTKHHVAADESFTLRLDSLRKPFATLSFAQTLTRTLCDSQTRVNLLTMCSQVVPLNAVAPAVQAAVYREAPDLRPQTSLSVTGGPTAAPS